MLLHDQHTSFRMAFCGLVINRFMASRAPASIAICVSVSEPVSMLPIVRRHETEMAISLCSKSSTILGKTLVYNKVGNCSAPPSEIYDMAQQTSPMISSESFSISTLARLNVARFIFSKSGAGLPLHRFDRVQLAFRTKVLPAGARSK